MSTPDGLAAFMVQPNINYLLGEDDGVFCGVVAVRNIYGECEFERGAVL
jgi:hypothetical protein